jgi:hypothetical protein
MSCLLYEKEQKMHIKQKYRFTQDNLASALSRKDVFLGNWFGLDDS